MTYKHPNDLPPIWRERWEERSAIVWEGCRYPDTREGHAAANRAAFEMILRDIERESRGWMSGDGPATRS